MLYGSSFFPGFGYRLGPLNCVTIVIPPMISEYSFYLLSDFSQFPLYLFLNEPDEIFNFLRT